MNACKYVYPQKHVKQHPHPKSNCQPTLYNTHLWHGGLALELDDPTGIAETSHRLMERIARMIPPGIPRRNNRFKIERSILPRNLLHILNRNVLGYILKLGRIRHIIGQIRRFRLLCTVLFRATATTAAAAGTSTGTGKRRHDDEIFHEAMTRCAGFGHLLHVHAARVTVDVHIGREG